VGRNQKEKEERFFKVVIPAYAGIQLRVWRWMDPGNGRDDDLFF
jgi:hypothetical protein